MPLMRQSGFYVVHSPKLFFFALPGHCDWQRIALSFISIVSEHANTPKKDVNTNHIQSETISYENMVCFGVLRAMPLGRFSALLVVLRLPMPWGGRGLQMLTSVGRLPGPCHFGDWREIMTCCAIQSIVVTM